MKLPRTGRRMRKQWSTSRMLLIILGVMILLIGGCTMQKTATTKMVSYTNPLSDDGGSYSDPWLIRIGKHYYYCGSDGKGKIIVKRSTDPTTILEAADKVVYESPATGPYSTELWAPEMHYLAGHWYIYVAADDGENANHRMYALVGGTNAKDPLDGKFTFKGKVADNTDRWAIDGTVLTLKDKLYFIWSGWSGTENVAQNLYIAPMSNPYTINGPRVLISVPTESWERHGQPYVNEGPEILTHGDQVNLIYSASGSWTDDYCLGQLSLTGKDPLKASAWQKKKQPVFKKTDKVFGPGHGSFITSPDGTSWIMYHAAKVKGSGWDRDIRLQSFSWHDDETPAFGKPVAPDTKLEYPLN